MYQNYFLCPPLIQRLRPENRWGEKICDVRFEDILELFEIVILRTFYFYLPILGGGGGGGGLLTL